MNKAIRYSHFFCLSLLFCSLASSVLAQNGYYWMATTVHYQSQAQADSMQAIVKKYQPRMLQALRDDGVVLDEIALFKVTGPENHHALFLHKIASWAGIEEKSEAFRKAWYKVCSEEELNEVRSAFRFITNGVKEGSSIYREVYKRD